MGENVYTEERGTNMSRSYKKQPFYHSGGPLSKRRANKILRAKLNNSDTDSLLPQGNMYRRYAEQYEINDYISYWPLAKAKEDWRTTDRLLGRYETEADFIQQCWAKTQKRK